MELQSYIKKIDTKEVATCVLLIVVGYMTAQLFMRKYNGFRVGGQNSCYFGNDMTCKLGTFAQGSGGRAPNPDPCSKAKDCNKSWWQSKSDGGGNGKTPIGIACKYEKDKCITPGTGFHAISGCPTKSCANSPPPPPGGNSPPPPPPGGNSPPPPPPSASGQCILGGYLSFSNDGCIYKGKTYEDYTDAPKGTCDCKSMLSPSKISFTLIMIALVFFFIIIPIFIYMKPK